MARRAALVDTLRKQGGIMFLADGGDFVHRNWKNSYPESIASWMEMARLRYDAVTYGELEFEFFHVLATASHNLVFVFLLNSIRRLYRNNLDFFAPLVRDPAKTAAHHGRVVDAVQAQDGEEASRLARTFLEAGLARIVESRRGST